MGFLIKVIRETLSERKLLQKTCFFNGKWKHSDIGVDSRKIVSLIDLNTVNLLNQIKNMPL